MSLQTKGLAPRLAKSALIGAPDVGRGHGRAGDHGEGP